MIGVAISTTGDEHRLPLLEQCVAAWTEQLSKGFAGLVFVTVDGSAAAVERVVRTIGPEDVYRVGRPKFPGDMDDEHRLGVAANKNTGIELLMDAGARRLFLSDDDTWPLNGSALDFHTARNAEHSMVNWGAHRLDNIGRWTWPRGSVLYATRHAVETVGGMVEAFGAGGHEHVEWSRRIHQHGLTDVLYPAPVEYRQDQGMGARAFWHAEDMQKIGEPRGTMISRRRALTSVRRRDGDVVRRNQLLDTLDGYTNYVPYHAERNGRGSATLYRSITN